MPHPGGEHLVDNPGYNFNYKLLISSKYGEMPWNTAPKHRRKFISSTGDYIDEKGIKHENEEIFFWGEWEQESLFEKTNNNNKNNPQYIHTPLCKKSEISDWIKNGNSFNSHFQYLCCCFFKKNKIQTHMFLASTFYIHVVDRKENYWT